MKKSESNKNQGFQFPENYFQDFDERLEKEIALSELIPKTSGFKIPDGYMDCFENSLLTKIKKANPNAKVIKLQWLYTAATIAAVLVIGFFILKPQPAYTTTNVDELSVSDIDTYIDEGFLGLNSYDLIETFNDVPLEDIEMTEPIPEDDIIDYLTEKNMENYGILLEDK